MASNNNTQTGFMTSTLQAVEVGKFAFYLSFVGIIIQFVHNVLAIAGTLDIFNPGNTALTLFIGEWLLALGLGGFFAFTLWLFTIRTSKLRITTGIDEGQRKELINKYMGLIVTYTFFDFLIDIYFWIYIVYMQGDLAAAQNLGNVILNNWILLVVMIPIAIMLPLTLQFYSREIIKKEKKNNYEPTNS